ncbi:inositol monophosphatase [Photobacterium jeanii]|uniref:Inosine/xanthosine triphosphatase n=1 Tax=Photobacterium jeanii TaxID=858640 RepID=A0A178KAR6_9GAMM|nr:inosine/xanthosine triphosphatase [Photobacterium jeanii]OAN14217.1 inositol monophosphatase [Photobacterium jeanii]PST89738.1 non-canonical purine NTP phosphatase [Photobacterium jeanii]
MSTVIVASTNPAKISAVENAFNQAFPHHNYVFEGISVASEVRDQPMTADETLLGARNRVKNAKAQVANAAFYVGLEAGIDGDHTFAWMVIENSDDQSKRGEARSASLPLPPAALAQLHQGAELGDVMDEMFNEHNIKQKGGAIAMLTNHKLSRSSVYEQALILALIPFMNAPLFP